MDLYPEELKEDPVPVVSLVGAKKYHAALQKNLSVVPSLFDEGQRPIFYILSSEREEGLPKKKKQKSVAPSVVMDDQPGILKSNWMYKNSRVIPAVVVFIFSEWANEKKWKEKEPEFCAFLEKAKTKLRSRNIKTLVALVQRTHSEIIDERLNGFRKRADLDAKKIVFLTKTDMAESAKRLEKAVQVLAAIHYRELSHRKKKQKEKLNKAVQKSLLVRYSFEIGFFAEFRSDTKGALKYYTEAYKNIGAITDDRLRMMEVKIVADYINFKLCKLQFQAKNAYNAVNQFEKHIHAFRPSIGAAEKEYEHWAWVSRQYQVFGELLEKNPSLASVEDRKFFPGFYYQASARYAIDRKNVAKKLCEPIRGSPLYTQYQDTESFSLVGIDHSRQKYVGQVPAVFQNHPLESGAQSKVPSEMDQLYRSLVQELRVDHASLIISLLTKAYTHYKRISSSRVMLQLASLMAHQYLASGKYQDAKDFFDHIAKNYRNEKWWQLLTFTLDSAAQCALQMGLTKDFVEYALELLGPNLSYNIQQKQTIQSQLLSALVSPSTLSLPELKASLQRTPADTLVFCKVHFCEDKVCVGETISFQVMLLSNFPSPLRFHKLRVGFSQNIYDIQVVDPLPATDTSAESPLVLQDEYSNLLLLPGVARTYSFEFSAKEKAELQCKNVFLEFGRPSSSICFRWDTPDLILSSGAINNKPTLSKQLSLSRYPERTKMHITALAPEISVNVSQQAPALVNEFYAMHLEVLNHEKEKASGLLSFLVDGSYAEEIGFFVGKGSTKEPVQEIEFEEIASKSSFRTTVYVFFPTPGTRNIKFQVSYETVLRSKTTFQESVSVTVQKPFHINYSFYSKDLQPIFNPSSSTSSSATTNTTSPSSIPALSKLAVNEPFFLQVDIQPTTSYYLSVESVSLVLNTNKSLVPVADYLPISSTKTEAIVFNNNKRYSFWFEVVPFVGGDNVNLGVFSMEWKRYTFSLLDHLSLRLLRRNSYAFIFLFLLTSHLL
ncbi:Trafficking protein particle complex subunit 11, variant 2 [Balamuthia mandrillaris]